MQHVQNATDLTCIRMQCNAMTPLKCSIMHSSRMRMNVTKCRWAIECIENASVTVCSKCKMHSKCCWMRCNRMQQECNCSKCSEWWWMRKHASGVTCIFIKCTTMFNNGSECVKSKMKPLWMHMHFHQMQRNALQCPRILRGKNHTYPRSVEPISSRPTFCVIHACVDHGR